MKPCGETIEVFNQVGACDIRGEFKDYVEVLSAGIARNIAELGANVKVYSVHGAGAVFW